MFKRHHHPPPPPKDDDVLKHLLEKLIRLVEILIKNLEKPKIRSGVISRVHHPHKGELSMANEQIAVGASAEYQVTWFDGPNGTGNVVSATVASVWSSGSEANLTAVSDGMQTAMVTGIAAGTGIDVTATDPTSGTQAAPLAFDVTSVIVPPGPIVSGVITRVPPAAAALR